MRKYTVTWTIEVEDENPEEAARQAFEIMQDQDSTATVFEVMDTGCPDSTVTIDLMEGVNPTQDHEYVCSTWFERDRAMVSLSRPDGSEVFCLWDEEVGQAIEDGFLSTPRHFRPTESQWQPHAVVYAREMGYIV